MTLPNSMRSYDDCYEIFQAAIDDGRGAKIAVNDGTAGHYLRNRMNHARVLDRQKNCQIYEMDHPMFGCSEFDKVRLRVQNTEEGWFLIAECYSALNQGRIIGLSEATDGRD